MNRKEIEKKNVYCFICGRLLFRTSAKGVTQLICPKCKASFKTDVGTSRLTLEYDQKEREL